MTAYDHLIELNVQLIAALDVAEDALPAADTLDPLLASRAMLLDAVERSAPSIPDTVRTLLLDQHQRIDALLETRLATLHHNQHRLDLLERARGQYAAAPARQVLRSSLNA